jgi:hypothetical protein
MRHHRLPLLTGLGVLGLGFALASCNVSTEVGSYSVTYRANVSNVRQMAAGGDSVVGGQPVYFAVATIDSILYSPGTGKCLSNCNADSTLIKLTTPSANAQGINATELFLPSGATVQATLYGNGTATGTAQFTVIWMTASGTVRGDSVSTATSAGTKFTLTINKRTI